MRITASISTCCLLAQTAAAAVPRLSSVAALNATAAPKVAPAAAAVPAAAVPLAAAAESAAAALKDGDHAAAARSVSALFGEETARETASVAAELSRGSAPLSPAEREAGYRQRMDRNKMIESRETFASNVGTLSLAAAAAAYGILPWPLFISAALIMSGGMLGIRAQRGPYFAPGGPGMLIPLALIGGGVGALGVGMLSATGPQLVAGAAMLALALTAKSALAARHRARSEAIIRQHPRG